MAGIGQQVLKIYATLALATSSQTATGWQFGVKFNQSKCDNDWLSTCINTIQCYKYTLWYKMVI